MEILYLLIPLAILLVALIALAFLWSIKSGQFDDLEGPAWRILHDDEAPPGAALKQAEKKPNSQSPEES